MFRRRGEHLVEELLRDDDAAILIRHDNVVGEHRHAAAPDRLLPADEGEARDGGRSSDAAAPNGKLRPKHAGDIAHDAVGDEPRGSALSHPRAENVAEDAGVGDPHRVHYRDATLGHRLDRRAR